MSVYTAHNAGRQPGRRNPEASYALDYTLVVQGEIAHPPQQILDMLVALEEERLVARQTQPVVSDAAMATADPVLEPFRIIPEHLD